MQGEVYTGTVILWIVVIFLEGISHTFIHLPQNNYHVRDEQTEAN